MDCNSAKFLHNSTMMCEGGELIFQKVHDAIPNYGATYVRYVRSTLQFNRTLIKITSK